MEERISSALIYLSEFIRCGYGYSIFVLVIFYLFKNKLNSFHKTHLLEIVNYSILLYAYISILIILLNIFIIKNEGQFEKYVYLNRAFGPYWWSFWFPVACNLLLPQFFWFEKLRKNIWFSFAVMLLIFSVELAEQIIIILTSTHRDYVPSSWQTYYPKWNEILYNLPFVLIYWIIIYSIYRMRSKLKKQNTESLEE
jgi:molybdopterin-containing oxidoreductase family membrane subunit